MGMTRSVQAPLPIEIKEILCYEREKEIREESREEGRAEGRGEERKNRMLPFFRD